MHTSPKGSRGKADKSAQTNRKARTDKRAPGERNVQADKLTKLNVTEQSELLSFLLTHIPNKSRNNIKSLLARHQVSVDNAVVSRFDHPLQPGQQVVVNWAIVEEPPQGLNILFEDPDIIVIEKQAGMLSIATEKEKEITAYSILSEHVKKRNPKNRIFVVHRLDRDTSGVMLFAKNESIKQALQKAWKDIVQERTYIVVAEGKFTKDQGSITSWLKETKSMLVYSSRTPNDGQQAITHFRVLKRNANFSMLAVNLETGRKNQIRVHMQDLGHSIIGDKKYGSTKNPINRLGLHAQVLAFRHPVTGEEMRFESEIPEQFLRLFN
ncbi:MAG TPA: RluA family pseudouridine synthase [Verrucomicrobiae bacterium]|nr:RluA family pseudouridine synthase [Verrucomicrobiae bacterium]